MEKITVTKTIKYYNMEKFINTAIIEKRQFLNIQDALEYLKNYDLKYIINKKGISAHEELGILHQADYKTFIKYYKTIDLNTLTVHDNLKKENNEDVL